MTTPLLLALTLSFAVPPAAVELPVASARTSVSARQHGLYLMVAPLAAVESTGIGRTVGGGGGGGITSGTTIITGGNNTSVCFNDAGVMNCGDTGFLFDKTANTITVLGNIELGHASANTLSASSGVLSIEGVNLVDVSSAQSITGKTIPSFELGTAATDTTITRSAAGWVAVEGNLLVKGNAQQITVAGPTAARTYTFADASYTVPGLSLNNTWTGAQTFATGGTTLNSDQVHTFGTSSNSQIQYDTANTPDATKFGTATSDNAFHITESGDTSADMQNCSAGSSAATDPTLCVHSHNQTTTEWIDFKHNATDGVIDVGTGGIDWTGVTGTYKYDRTVTTAGTTGAQTINKTSGTVNFAAAATTIVVTNSLVGTSSIVYAVRRTNDTTCFLASVEPGSGSFTIRMTAACTAETSVGFFVTN